MVTPTRGKATKALARRNMRTLANECFEHKKMKFYLLSRFRRAIKSEIKKISTYQSPLCSPSPDDLRNFSWDTIHDELQ